MTRSAAEVVRVRADSVSFEGVAFRSDIMSLGASGSCYVFDLIAGHSLVEVGDVLE